MPKFPRSCQISSQKSAGSAKFVDMGVTLFPIFHIAMTVLCNLSERSRNAVSDDSTTVATSLSAKLRTVLIYVLRGAIIVVTAPSSVCILHETYTNDKRHPHHSKFCHKFH